MEENVNNPMIIFQSFVDQIFVLWLAKGILGKQKDEMRRKILRGILGKFERIFFEFGV
jgi:hypothetical protein